MTVLLPTDTVGKQPSPPSLAVNRTSSIAKSNSKNTHVTPEVQQTPSEPSISYNAPPSTMNSTNDTSGMIRILLLLGAVMLGICIVMAIVVVTLLVIGKTQRNSSYSNQSKSKEERRNGGETRRRSHQFHLNDNDETITSVDRDLDINEKYDEDDDREYGTAVSEDDENDRGIDHATDGVQFCGRLYTAVSRDDGAELDVIQIDDNNLTECFERTESSDVSMNTSNYSTTYLLGDHIHNSPSKRTGLDLIPINADTSFIMNQNNLCNQQNYVTVDSNSFEAHFNNSFNRFKASNDMEHLMRCSSLDSSSILSTDNYATEIPHIAMSTTPLPRAACNTLGRTDTRVSSGTSSKALLQSDTSTGASRSSDLYNSSTGLAGRSLEIICHEDILRVVDSNFDSTELDFHHRGKETLPDHLGNAKKKKDNGY